jgi:hypothetical protein
MGTSTKTVSRPKAVLNLPEYEVPLFIAYARSIVRAMTNNQWFPSPVPSLATVEAAIDVLANAETATLTRRAGTVEDRNTKRHKVKILLEQLCSYVQRVADANREHAVSIIESAGMSVKKKGGPKQRTFTAKMGLVSGMVILIAPQAGNRAAYEWQYRIDGVKTWVDLPTTVQATTRVSDLTPGSTLWFRYRAVTKKVTSDWSEPTSLIVH